MFKKVVPVLSLLLLAGPVFAADTTAPSADTSASAPAKSSHKKHHGKKHTKGSTGTEQSGQPKSK
jgi:hypothetical protein